MKEIRYRLYFGKDPATQEQLDKVEEIKVEQEIDMTWEAQIKFLIYTDKRGRWTTEDMDFLNSFSRVRVEIKNGTESFEPLIEGPVVGYDNRMSSQPGQSSVSLKVRDDSVYLEMEEETQEFIDKPDHQIAEELLDAFKEYIKVEPCEPQKSFKSPTTPHILRRSSTIAMLRQLAKRQGYYFYILPGDEPGKSKAYFHSISLKKDSELPPFILTGTNRNIEDFDISFNPIRPVKVTASYLDTNDKNTVTATSSYGNMDTLAKENPLGSEDEFGKVYLPPLSGGATDMEQVVNAEGARASYAFEARGTVRRFCYCGVLEPYRVVAINGLSGELCGNYLIQRVSHSLTRSYYDQSFSVTRNARSPVAGTDPSKIIGSLIS